MLPLFNLLHVIIDLTMVSSMGNRISTCLMYDSSYLILPIIVTNMIWMQLSHTNFIIIITRWLDLWISTCSNSLMYVSTLCIYMMYKISSQFLTVHFQIKSLGLICTVAKEKYFRKYDNHKTIEILCCESKNLKTNTPFQSYKDFVIFVHWFVLRLLWTGFDKDTLISLPTFLSYLVNCVHNRTSFSSVSER